MLNTRSQMAALMQKLLQSLGFAKLTSHHPALPSLQVCTACCANRKWSAGMVPRHSHKESQLHTCLHILHTSPRATYDSTCYTRLHMLCTASTYHICISTCYMHLCTLHTRLHMLHSSTCYTSPYATCISTCCTYLHITNIFPHATCLHMLYTSPHATPVTTY